MKDTRNILCFILGFLVVSFVLLMGEAGKQRTEQHDYQAYSKQKEVVQ